MGQEVKHLILINSDKIVLVDAKYWLELALSSWKLSGYGYPMDVRTHEYLHIVVAAKFGLKGKIDHKDQNKLNCVGDNLREATQSQNAMNSVKRKSKCSSKHKGVCWETQSQKWLATINVEKKRLFLGRYVQEEDAAKAYNEAAKKHFGAFASLNPV